MEHRPEPSLARAPGSVAVLREVVDLRIRARWADLAKEERGMGLSDLRMDI